MCVLPATRSWQGSPLAPGSVIWRLQLALCAVAAPAPHPRGAWTCNPRGMAGDKRKGSRKEKRRRKRRRRSRSRSTDGSGSSGSSGRRRRPSPRRLLTAAALGDKQQCRELLKSGADVAFADAKGTTALHEVRALMGKVWRSDSKTEHFAAATMWPREHAAPRAACPHRRAGTATCPRSSSCCGGAQTGDWAMCEGTHLVRPVVRSALLLLPQHLDAAGRSPTCGPPPPCSAPGGAARPPRRAGSAAASG